MNADGYYLDYTFIEALEKYFGEKYGIELVLRIEEDWFRHLQLINCFYKRGNIPVLKRIKLELPCRKDDCRAAQFVADSLEGYLEEEFSKKVNEVIKNPIKAPLPKVAKKVVKSRFCECCGAPINFSLLKCEYCNTEYITEGEY